MVLTRRDSVIAETSGVGANVLAQPPSDSGSGAGAANREACAAMTSEPTSDRRSDSKFVEFIDVQKMYGDFHAVRRLNLSIGQGEFLTFLGPSGSGKTTTLNMLAGFERPSQGVIRLAGKSVDRLPPYERNIGMVFQNYALFPHMSVEQNVAFPLSVRKTPKADIGQRVRRALEMVRLEKFAERKPSQMS